MKGMNRRDFLKMIGTGTAVVSVPLIANCKDKHRLAKIPRANSRRDSIGKHTTYFDRFGVCREMIGRILRKGLTRGGDFSEIFLQHKITHVVGIEDGKVDRAHTKVLLGAGIRVIKGNAQGFAYSEDLTERALLSTAEAAAGVADTTQRVRPTPLRVVTVKNNYPIRVPWTVVGIDKKLPLVEMADRLARKHDRRIIKVNVYLRDKTSQILVANSEGRLVEDHHPMATLWVGCVGRYKGKTENSGDGAASANGLEFFSPALLRRVAHTAVVRTTMLFGADTPPTGSYPVVLAPALSGILLHEAIGHGLEADFNRKGISIYADRLGKRIAKPLVNIYDDGTIPRMRGSINIDDESIPGQKTLLVEKGVLRSYMHDRISARHYKVASTGSGRRASFRHPPVPRMRNTYMAEGPHKAAEIIRSVQKGLYAEAFTNGQVDIGAGDFSFYLKHGRMIENGKLTCVVKDANLIGRGPEVLETVDMVADDLDFYAGGGACGKDGQRVPVSFGLPTVRVGAISIGGRKT
jgi:TldD protein